MVQMVASPPCPDAADAAAGANPNPPANSIASPSMASPRRPFGPRIAQVSSRVRAPRLRGCRVTRSTRTGAVRLRSLGLACLPDCLDQVPLPHARTPGDVLPLGHLVQVLPGSVLEVPAGLAAAGPGPRGLPAEVLAHRLREWEDRLLRLRGLARLHDVPLGRLHLLLRRHAASPPVMAHLIPTHPIAGRPPRYQSSLEVGPLAVRLGKATAVSDRSDRPGRSGRTRRCRCPRSPRTSRRSPPRVRRTPNRPWRSSTGWRRWRRPGRTR